MSLKIITIIPARAGSKGIANKNLFPLAGRPMMSYSIQASVDCELISETYVSTDSQEIMRCAEVFGAKSIHRPDEMCQDHSSSELALLHFANHIDFDILCFMQATSPLVTSNILTSAITYYNQSNIDSLISGYEDHGFWWRDKLPLYDPDNRPTRQQQKNEGTLYRESGMFYITSREKLLKSKCRYSGSSEIYPVKKMLSIDVDSIEDVQFIELIMQQQNEQNKIRG